jgi:lipoate-protein ligase B
MLDLKNESSGFQADLHWYLRKVEDVVLLTLERYGIEGNRDPINTGVWVGQEKVAAVGISSSRWITTHGFALNVDPDLDCFDTSIILPCGIEGRGVTSMGKLLRAKNESVPGLDEVAGVVTETMQEVFGATIVP